MQGQWKRAAPPEAVGGAVDCLPPVGSCVAFYNWTDCDCSRVMAGVWGGLRDGRGRLLMQTDECNTQYPATHWCPDGVQLPPPPYWE